MWRVGTVERKRGHIEVCMWITYDQGSAEERQKTERKASESSNHQWNKYASAREVHLEEQIYCCS